MKQQININNLREAAKKVLSTKKRGGGLNGCATKEKDFFSKNRRIFNLTIFTKRSFHVLQLPWNCAQLKAQMCSSSKSLGWNRLLIKPFL